MGKGGSKKPTSGFVRSLTKRFLPKKLTKFQRSAVLAGTLSLVLVFTAVLALAFNESTDQQQTDEDRSQEVVEIETAPAMKATVTLREGVVEYRTDGIWDIVPQDLEITSGMTLRTTGAASRAIISLEDGTAVRVDANTQLRFETLTTVRVVIVQESGHIYNRITSSEERTYVVQTENAQFQSIGTAFRTNASGDEESAEVFQGSIRETTNNIRAALGEKLTVKNNVDPSKDNTVEGLNIEQLKDDSFIVWNRQLDQESEAFKDALGFLSDFDGPPITISSPAGGSTIDVGPSASTGFIEINGNTERRATLTVQSKSLPGSSPINVSVDDNGNFTTPSLEAPVGTSVFELIATDRVGNKTTLNVSYLFSKKSTVQEQGIALTIDDSDPDELVFEWGLVGMTTPDGVQLVYGTNSDPTYGDDTSVFEDGTSATIKTGPLNSEETYYFRVCRYDEDSDTCDVYSNEVTFEVE